jgi:hypothetical protein
MATLFLDLEARFCLTVRLLCQEDESDPTCDSPTSVAEAMLIKRNVEAQPNMPIEASESATLAYYQPYNPDEVSNI